MAGSHVYSDYHPRWLRRRVSTYWWIEKPAYFAFIVREATCMFVGWFVVYLLLLFNAVGGGADSYAQFMQWSATPWVLVLNLVSVPFIIYHAITFFQAAPQAMVVHLGHHRVPEKMILLGHYGAWMVASALVAWLVLRG